MNEEKIKEITEYYEKNKPRLEYNQTMFEILEGDLLDKILASLRTQTISDSAYEIEKDVVAPLNILLRVNDKLSKIYSEPPKRTSENENDQKLIEHYENEGGINVAFNEANKFFNATKMGAIEPFLDEGVPKVRSLMPQVCLPYSDDKMNPMRITHFIKVIGSFEKKVSSRKSKKVDILFIYSDQEFIAVDSDGDILPEYMENIEDGLNPIGVIPQEYIQKSKHMLIPLKDSDTLQMTILVPIMITHLNFAILMQSHSVLYGIDIDRQNLEMNPNSFWFLQSDPDSDKTPQIGSIKPTVDIDQVNNHIYNLFRNWLETKNVRLGEAKNGVDAASGIALTIKEMDATKDKKEQIVYFAEAEKDFWEKKLKVWHNDLVSKGEIVGLNRFSEDFSINIEFVEPLPVQNRMEEKEYAQFEIDNKLNTIKNIIMRLNPHLSEAQVDNLIKEIKKEEEELKPQIEVPFINNEEKEDSVDDEVDEENTKEV